MEPSQGAQSSDTELAHSNTSSTGNGSDQSHASQPTASPTDPATDDIRSDAAPHTRLAEDTVDFKPGDELYEAVRSAEEPFRMRARPKTDPNQVGTGRIGQSQGNRHTGPLEDRKAAYRHWLEKKSKDDLIDLLMGLEGQQFAPDHTEKLSMRPRLEEASGEMSRETYQIPEDMTFVRLPTIRKSPVNSPMPTWRVVLVALDQGARPLGLQIDSEIVVGRAAGDATPDLDLTPYGAKSKGVSRMHARLRPEMHSLVLVDNNSSNGTFWNKIRLPPNSDQLLKDGDVITFGRVNFLVKIVKPPSMRDTKTLL